MARTAAAAIRLTDNFIRDPPCDDLCGAMAQRRSSAEERERARRMAGAPGMLRHDCRRTPVTNPRTIRRPADASPGDCSPPADGVPVDFPLCVVVLNPPSILGPDAKNVTGASMNIPVEQAIRLFKQLGSQVKRIGVIYNRAKTSYLVKQAQAAARDQGLELVTREISSPITRLADDGTSRSKHSSNQSPTTKVLRPKSN